MNYPRASILFFLVMFIACKQDKKYHDQVADQSNSSGSEAIHKIREFQAKLNAEFRNPDTSPLPDRYRKGFEGLDFFPPDTNYRVFAEFKRTPDAVPFLMPTNTERKSREVVYGVARFFLDGQWHELEVYRNQDLMLKDGYEDYLFLPFLDGTNGKETYAGGRYVDLSIPEGDTLVIDFNRAYNPYCAYNPKYSCPIVPRVNTLDIEVPAGVKAFEPKAGK